MTKQELYKTYGIEYQGGKIRDYNEDSTAGADLGFVPQLLINGNAKLGKGVFTWSTLPGAAEYECEINGEGRRVKGTCPCNCEGCYAQTGFYRMKSTVNALGLRTVIARHHLDFMRRAIVAQIHAENIKLVRIHASGDFFNMYYVQAWQDIAEACPDTLFWTYTKYDLAVNAFNDYDNINVVKSVIPGKGFNFGHCDYILAVYEYLKNAGKRVYICRCGIDKNQHCINCRGCVDNDYVLFIEHSTAYKAESDPLFPILKNIIENQARA